MTAIAARTQTKSIPNLKPEEFAAMRMLTLAGFGGQGRMQPKLDESRRDENAFSTYVKNDEGDIIGWALTFHADGTANTYFFVHPDYRRQGVGTKLYRAVRRRFGVVRVYPWESVSSSFFRKVGAT